MKPIHTYFDKVYLINLDRRKDRLERVTAKCDLINLQFERTPALDAKEIPIPSFVFSMGDKNRFTPGAYALAMTTKEIIKNAMEQKLERILILEDDIQWHPWSTSIFYHAYKQLPVKWDCLMLSAENRQQPEQVCSSLYRAKRSFLCSAYALNHTIFEDYYHFLCNCDKPIDNWMVNVLQPRGRVYVTHPIISTQVPDYSDISNMYEEWKVNKNDNSNLALP